MILFESRIKILQYVGLEVVYKSSIQWRCPRSDPILECMDQSKNFLCDAAAKLVEQTSGF